MFVQTAPVDLPRLDEVGVDGRVVVFAFLTTLLTAMLVSILPLWHMGGRDPQAVLRSGSAAAGQGPAGLTARTALTALQIAVTITLLTVTTLLGVSLLRVLEVDYGFNAERVLVVPVAMPAARYADDARRVPLYDRLLEEVKSLPGVDAVSSTSLLPMRGEGQVNFVVAAGTNVPRSQQPSANFRLVAPEYFSSLELPVQRGRAFTLADRGEGKPMPAVISQSLAQRLWPETMRSARSFSRGIDGEAGFEVVGVAADARTTAIERTAAADGATCRTGGDRGRRCRCWSRPPVIRSRSRRHSARDRTHRPGDRRRPGAPVATARRCDAGGTPLPGAVVRRLRPGVAADRRARCLRGDRLRRVATAARDEHPRRAGRGDQPTCTGCDDTAGHGRAARSRRGLAGALAAGGAAASLLYEVMPREPAVLAGVAHGGGGAIAASMLATRNSLSIDPMAALRDE